MRTPPGLFVTGTDTAVGKTEVAAAVAALLHRQGRRVGVLKPVATGAARVGPDLRADDTDRLIAAVGGGIPPGRVTPLVYAEPLAPSLAARRTGRPLVFAEVLGATLEALGEWALAGVEVVVVEGVGGLLCPLADDATVADLALALDYPLVVVARRGLGTLNHTILTVEAARRRGLRVAGLVLNTPEETPETVAGATAAAELSRSLPGLAVLADRPFLPPGALSDPLVAVDWYGRAALPRLRPSGAGGGARPVAEGRVDDRPQEARPTMPSDPIEADDPRTPDSPAPPHSPAGFSGSSGDDLNLRLASAPDPLLGEFVADDATPGPVPDLPPEFSPDPVFEPTPGPEPGSGPAGSSADALAALDLDAPPHGKVVAVEDDDGDDDAPAGGPSLPLILLASYASAVTLGLLWVLLSGRRAGNGGEADFLPPAESRVDPGLRADRTRAVKPPAAVPADHLTTVGRPLRLGVIEVTPLALGAGPVRLSRAVKGRESKAGGDRALRLRLRLKNVSPDLIVAPLDEAFVRDRPGADRPDSLIEPAAGGPGATVAMYPLAVESEWRVSGQEFRDLRPGEAFETDLVSEPDALDHLAPEMTWRVRLRTGQNHTDDLGVRFRSTDVPRPPLAGRPEPDPDPPGVARQRP